MPNLIPEVRADKNGKRVTRHVRPGATAKPVAMPRPVAPGTVSSVTCTQCGRDRRRAVVHRCPAPDLLTLTAPALRVLNACRAAGGTPVLVGGCVRDALMSKAHGETVAPKDVDIEVYGITDPLLLIGALSRFAGKVDEAGASFGVLKVRVGKEDFDVSLPRRDSKTGDGHRGFATEVDPTLDEVTAFGRRDFTINAMGYDPQTQELIDPYGGAADLAAGVLRHTTEAFDEDPLRVLRAVQFASRFGFDLAPETIERAQSLHDDFHHLPVERIWGEFDKLFTKGRSVSKGLKALYEVGWEDHFPELAAIRDVPQDPKWHPEGAVHVHSALAGDAAVRIADRDGLTMEERRIAVLAAVVHDFGKAEHTQHAEDGSITSHGHAEGGVEPVRSFLSRIGAPAAVRDKVLPLVREHMCTASVEGTPTDATVRRLIRRLEGENGRGPTIRDWARVLEADATGRGSGSKESRGGLWLEVAERVGTAPGKPILRGEHLMARGMKPGPAFAPIIKASLAAQDSGEFSDEAGALAWLARRLETAGQQQELPGQGNTLSM